jgi:hypothetical protein
VHGALARSRVSLTSPSLVAIENTGWPALATPVDFGGWTGLDGSPLAVYSHVSGPCGIVVTPVPGGRGPGWVAPGEDWVEPEAEGFGLPGGLGPTGVALPGLVVPGVTEPDGLAEPEGVPDGGAAVPVASGSSTGMVPQPASRSTATASMIRRRTGFTCLPCHARLWPPTPTRAGGRMRPCPGSPSSTPNSPSSRPRWPAAPPRRRWPRPSPRRARSRSSPPGIGPRPRCAPSSPRCGRWAGRTGSTCSCRNRTTSTGPPSPTMRPGSRPRRPPSASSWIRARSTTTITGATSSTCC